MKNTVTRDYIWIHRFDESRESWFFPQHSRSNTSTNCFWNVKWGSVRIEKFVHHSHNVYYFCCFFQRFLKLNSSLILLWCTCRTKTETGRNLSHQLIHPHAKPILEGLIFICSTLVCWYLLTCPCFHHGWYCLIMWSSFYSFCILTTRKLTFLCTNLL